MPRISEFAPPVAATTADVIFGLKNGTTDALFTAASLGAGLVVNIAGLQTQITANAAAAAAAQSTATGAEADAQTALSAAMAAALATSATKVVLSHQPGIIDLTGGTDYHDILNSAIQNTAALGFVLEVDFPCWSSTLLDYTKPIFVPSNSKLTFTPVGEFILDNTGPPSFVFPPGVSNIVWENYSFRYIGQFGTTGIDYTGAFFGAINNFNNITMTNWLIAHNGNTFGSGGNSFFPGPSNICTVNYISGNAQRIQFTGTRCKQVVPQATLASAFCPNVFSMNANWNFGVTGITSGTTITNSNGSAPNDIRWEGWTLDGFLFGWQGVGTNLIFENIKAKRYSDLEASDGTNIGGVSLWFAPPHLFYFLAGTNPQFPVSCSYHMIDESATSFVTSNANKQRRLVSSGFINSLKTDLGSGVTVKDYKCRRAEGFCDGIAHGYQGGSFTGVDVICDMSVVAEHLTLTAAPTSTSTGGTLSAPFDFTTGTYTIVFSDGSTRAGGFTNASTTVTWGALTSNPTAAITVGVSGGIGGFRFPVGSMTTWVCEASILDVATIPFGWPMQAPNTSGDVNAVVDLKIQVQDYHEVATYSPGFAMSGKNVRIKQEYQFNNCAATQTLRGPINNASSNAAVDSFIEATLEGWRVAKMTIAVSSTTATITRPTGFSAGFPYPTGTYMLVFDDNEIRFCAFTQNSTSGTLTQALTGTPGTTVRVYLLNTVNHDGYRARTQMFNNRPGSKALITDVSNNMVLDMRAGKLVSTWDRMMVVTPPAGASYTSPIDFPTTYAITEAMFGVSTTFGTGSSLTTITLKTGSTTLLAAQSHSTGGAANPYFNAVTYNGAMVLAADAGSFDGTGVAVFTVQGRRSELSG